MALIKCPKCNHEISDTTKKCIHCGTKLSNNKSNFNFKIIFIILISILIVSGSIFAYNSFFNKSTDNHDKVLENNKPTDDENKPNDLEDNTTNNETTLPPTENENKENDSNNKSNNITNKPNNSNNASNNNNNASSNTPVDNTPKKTIIDATKNESCPSGYEYKEYLSYTGSPCQKMNIVNGTITYYCLLDSQTLEENKCKSVYTSKPVGGKCYNNSVLNNGMCESVSYTKASTRLTCPSGYTKHNDTQCYNWVYEKAIINYSCPSGYTLKGNKCEK